MALQGIALPFPKFQLFTNLGAIAANHRLAFYEAGTSTPLTTYSDSAMLVPNANPLTLDAAGRAVVYINPRLGYKVAFLPPVGNDTPIWTQDNVFDSAAQFVSRLGYELQVGARDVTNGYTILSTDVLVTVASSGGPNPCVINLPAANTRLMPIFIKNKGNVPLAITRNGADTIELSATPYTLPDASSPPRLPTIQLVSDLVNNWWVLSQYS